MKDKAYFFVNTEGIRYIFGSIHTPARPRRRLKATCWVMFPRMRQRRRSIQCFQSVQRRSRNCQAAPTDSKRSPTARSAGSCVGFRLDNPARADCISGSRQFPAGSDADECTQSWTQSVSSGNKEWLLSGRVDYNLGDNDKIFGRVRFDRGTQPTYTDSINPVFNDFSIQPQNEGQLNYTHIFSPTVVNNFIFSVSVLLGGFRQLESWPSLALFPGNLAFS